MKDDVGAVFMLNVYDRHLDKGNFCLVRRLLWCNDTESYAGGNKATGRATLLDRSIQRLALQVGGWADGPTGQHPTTREGKKNLDKGSEKWTVYPMNDIQHEKG
jgi:hypothetical protein